MSAIAATYVLSGLDARADDLLSKALAALSPFGSGVTRRWSTCKVALGVNPSDTLPEDRFDREPILDGFVLAADLRLDNRDELRRSLEVSSDEASGMSDSQWVRLAWRRWGADCVDHLLGDFAFVVWDPRSRSLVCAVDPLARRPLFFHVSPGRLIAVASMPLALLALPGVRAAIDSERFASLLAVSPPPHDRSYFRSIAVLPAGHVLRVTESGIELRRYYQPRRRMIRYRRDQEYVEHFNEVFGRAVRDRLRSAGGVGTLLSAGLDSGAVSTVAAEILARRGHPLTAITWRPRPGAQVPQVRHRLTDESRGAAAVAARCQNVTHVFVDGDEAKLLPLLDEAARLGGQPVASPLKVALYEATAGSLRDRGCRVLLTGEAGNRTVSYDGRMWLRELFREGRWVQMLAELCALGIAGRPVRGSLFDAVAPSLPDGVARWIADRARRGGRRQLGGMSAIKPAFAARYGITEMGLVRRADRVDSWSSRVARMAADEGGIVHKAMYAQFGFEWRDPTLDLRVVEYCLSIPDDQYFRNGQPRWLIRRAMHDKLPQETLDGWQRGLQAPDWPRFLDAVRPDLVRHVARFGSSPLLTEALDLNALRTLLQDWPSTWKPDHLAPYAYKLLRAVAAGIFVLRCGSPAERGADAFDEGLDRVAR